MFVIKVFQLFIFLNLDYSDCTNVCNDWIQYKDIKCLKVLEQKGTEGEALNICTKLDQNSILLTIHSKDEQEYLNNFLEKFHNISLNVWLGLKYTEKTFEWMDGTNADFTNWSDDAVKNGSTQCVEMSLIKDNIGKWQDKSCKSTALIVCQKKQEFNLINLKNALDYLTKIYEDMFSKQETQFNSQNNKIENLTQVIERQENKIKTLEETTIPIGFLYTQLPNQKSPQELWPNTNWTEITSQYSGLFFRAEGEESLPFGQIQQANQSWISDVKFNGCHFDTWTSKNCITNRYTSLKRENWIEIAHGDQYSRAINHLQFYTTIGEFRPKNTAIKIFKRIQ